MRTFSLYVRDFSTPKTLLTKAHCIRTIAPFSFIGQFVWAFRLLSSLIGQGFVSCGYNNIKRQAISVPLRVFSHETFSPIHIQLLYGPRTLPQLSLVESQKLF